MFLLKSTTRQSFRIVRRAMSGTSLHSESLAQPAQFWSKAAQEIDWMKAGGSIVGSNEHFPNWFSERTLNMAVNCVFRHIPARASQAAIIYDSPVTETSTTISYGELAEKVIQFAGALQAEGVGKGDRVLIYMPNIPEAAVAMLASATLGAIHSVVFGGFAPTELATRIRDCNPKVFL